MGHTQTVSVQDELFYSLKVISNINVVKAAQAPSEWPKADLPGPINV